MENNNDSLSASSLRDRRTGLDADSSEAEGLIVSGCTPQLEFDAATNRRIPLLEVPQANFSKGKNQPDDNRRTKWSKNMNKLVMQCYFKNDPSKRNYRKRIHVIWKKSEVLNSQNKHWLDKQEQLGQINGFQTWNFNSSKGKLEVKRENEVSKHV